jgi:glycosidase
MYRLPVFFGLFLVLAFSSLPARDSHEVRGADEVRYVIKSTPAGMEILVLGAGVDRPDQAVVIALGRPPGDGSPLVPPERGYEGSTVWLPFAADLIVLNRRGADGDESFVRRWNKTQWGPRQPAGDGVEVSTDPAQVAIRLGSKLLGSPRPTKLSVFMKDLAADDGWGRLYGALDAGTVSGTGERTIRHYLSIETGPKGTVFRRAGRTAPAAPKTRIYQMLPRLFGNTNETRKPNGTILENGSGKFADLNEQSLGELKAMGFTHIWVTGVLQQATATDYAGIGEPADDADLLKGVAGSPYAIRDYFDVSPDYAVEPANRLQEFKDMVARVHEHGLKVIIDFVPNHVARSYASTVKPDLTFGAGDDRTKFFDPQNNFFWLTGERETGGGGPPLRLPTVDAEGRITSPTVQVTGGGDGLFEPEKEHGRVTGNNVISWAPGRDTWYETVKLNFGYDFTDPAKATRRYPHGDQPDLPVPDTWKKMDEIVAYWQELRVDGFRADMAHMVPPEFWKWLVTRARARDPSVFFMAEAYDNDPSKVPTGDSGAASVTGGEVMLELLKAGFDAVYDDPVYDKLKEVYEGQATANDLDAVHRRPFFFDNALRYAENHDEVRLASPSQWGGHGMRVGRPVSALLFGLSRGPVMIYHGQEVGEPALGAEGFGTDNARTTIYDYWSMPEFAKWVNDGKFDGGRLSEEQKSLRDYYRRLLAVIDQPAFRDGDFFPLNPDNADNPAYGRGDGSGSGDWIYSYLRHDPASGQRMLVVVNLHPERVMRDVRVRFPRSAMRFLGWDAVAGSRTVPILAQDRLGEVGPAAAEVTTTPAEMATVGLPIKELQPMTAAYYELSSGQAPPRN